MTMATHGAIFVVLLVIVAFAEGHDNEGELKFGYKGAIRPEKWGSLSHAFRECSEGKLQSPINIDKNNIFFNKKLGSLMRDYRNANATLVNNGFNIGIEWACDTGFLSLDGKNYKLTDSLWHTPSEHTINGERYAAELQHFHRGTDGQIVVVAVLYKQGDADPFHTALKDHLANLSKETCADDEQVQVPFGIVDSKYMLRSSHKYYKYRGSLTLPHCTENVTWFVIGKVRELSDEQIEALKAPLDEDYKSNARPTQPLNARQLHLFDGNRSDDD